MDPRSLVRTSIERHGGNLAALSNYVHAEQELSGHEFKSAERLAQLMEQSGFEVQRGACGLATALIARCSVHPQIQDAAVAKRVLTVAFLSEYDALPNIGHACGHNLICAVGAAAALAFKESAEALGISVNVVHMGTPSEETDGGKIKMIKEGAFEGIDIALMAHPGSENVRAGKWLALAILTVDFYGKPAHASAAPWEGINALDAAVIAYQAISSLRQQTLPTNRIHGIIIKGGDAPNIIPDHTQLEYYIRSEHLADLEITKAKVIKCFEGAALSTGCTFTIKEDPSFADMRDNSALSLRYKAHMESFGEEFVDDRIAQETSRGSTGGVPQMSCLNSLLPVSLASRSDNSHAASNHDEAESHRACTLLTLFGNAMQCLDSCTHAAGSCIVSCYSNDYRYQSIPEHDASKDMGNVSHVVAGIHPIFDIGARGFTYHTAEFATLAGQPSAFHKAMITAQSLALTALDCIMDPSLMHQVNREFRTD